jgi:pyridoxal phosphate-dependent aminotransferase EpsN
MGPLARKRDSAFRCSIGGLSFEFGKLDLFPVHLKVGLKMALFTICFALFFLIAVIAVKGARALAIRQGWLDHPKGRSFHDHPMPRIGGIGMLMPLIVALLSVGIYPGLVFSHAFLPGLIFPALGIAALSFVEDCVELSRKIRIIAHISLAVWALWYFQDTWINGSLPLLGNSLAPYMLAGVLILWIVGLTNAYNFMDGIDGIAALQAIVTTLGWATVLFFSDGPALSNNEAELLVMVALLAGMVGFLSMNWSPAVIFLGDNGSTFLGFFFAVLPLYVASTGALSLDSALEAGVLFLWPFIVDPALTFLRRLIQREPVLEAHRTHLYQILAGNFRHRRRGHQITSLLFASFSVLGVLLYWMPWAFWIKLLILSGLWVGFTGVVLARTRGGAVGSVLHDRRSREEPRVKGNFRIFLSPPEVSDVEARRITEAFRSGFIAPVGPQVDAFEKALGAYLNMPGIQAVSSGTAAIHLGLRALGVGPGDCVLCPDLTFVASVNPVRYLGAEPVLVDVDPENWAIDVQLARQALRDLRSKGKAVKALVVVHAYGLPAPMDSIMAFAREEGLRVLEDCAGAFGARIGNQSVGKFGDAATFSFNGNKVLTTSGGGALYIKDADLRGAAMSWANQGKRPDVVGYDHAVMGYNYKLSNICAAIGLGQLETLQSRLDRKVSNYGRYRELLWDIEGIRFLPEPTYGNGNYWLSCVGLEDAARIPRIIESLRERGIEASPIWKPMHLQACNAGMQVFGGKVSTDIYSSYVSLPSGATLKRAEIEEVAACFRVNAV